MFFKNINPVEGFLRWLNAEYPQSCQNWQAVRENPYFVNGVQLLDYSRVEVLLGILSIVEKTGAKYEYSAPAHYLNNGDEGGSIHLVLTAHPTECMPLEVVQTLQELVGLNEKTLLEDDFYAKLWSLRLTNPTKPSVIDEINFIDLLYSQNLIEASVRLLRTNPEVEIKFGLWPGGDRDGHPEVTSSDLRYAVEISYQRMVGYYLTQIEDLMALGVEAEHIYKKLLAMSSFEKGYDTPQDFLNDVLAVTTVSNETESIMSDIKSLVNQFGFLFYNVEMRQSADLLHRAVADVLREYMQMEYPEPGERFDFLESTLCNWLSTICSIHSLDCELEPETERELSFLCEAQALQTRFGTNAVSHFILSGSTDSADVLAATLLCHFCGLVHENQLTLSIVPLFESTATLHDSAATLEQLFTSTTYRRLTGGGQEVMLGYSDSAKESGAFASLWHIRQAIRSLGKKADELGIQLQLFHGRGWNPARGGWSFEDREQWVPGGTVECYKVTLQGEALRHLLLTPQNAFACLESHRQFSLVLKNKPKQHSPNYMFAVMTRIANDSEHAYRSMFAQPSFWAWFERKTLIHLTEKLNWGSRPAKRAKTLSVLNLRAIPYALSWLQSQAGAANLWLGLGTALQQFIENEGVQIIHSM